MSNEEKVDRKIPRFPIFFKITTVPPIAIEISISELYYLRYDV